MLVEFSINQVDRGNNLRNADETDCVVFQYRPETGKFFLLLNSARENHLKRSQRL